MNRWQRLKRGVANWISGGQVQRLQEVAADLLADRMLEDSKWQRASSNEGMSQWNRDDLRTWARWAFEGGDPFVKRAVQGTTEFTFGRGINQPQVADDDPASEPLRRFWNDPGNQAALFSTMRQYERSNQLQLDGDLFLLFYEATDPPQVRRIGPSLVKSVITDPGDQGRPLYYRIERPVRQYDETSGTVRDTGANERVFYRDLLNSDPVTDPLLGTIEAEENVYLLHTPINRISESGFGVSEVAASVSWLIRARAIAEDQATISKATAALMTYLELEGTDDDIDEMISDLEAMDPPEVGSMNMLGEGRELRVNRASTQGNDAWTNSRLMRIPAAAGLSVPLHYLSDPENANLATATSMELPVVRHMEAYQALIIDMYRHLCDAALRAQGVDPMDSDYQIPVPQIERDDVQMVAAASLDSYAEGVLTREQAARRVMKVLGFDNIGREIESLQAETEEPSGDSAEAMAAFLEQEDVGPPEDDA